MEKNTLYCSFCNKSQHDVLSFIAGPHVFICSECVALCVEAVGSSHAAWREEQITKLVSFRKQSDSPTAADKSSGDPA